MKTLALILTLCTPIYAVTQQQIEFALLLAAEQPAEQSIARHTPNCTWITPKLETPPKLEPSDRRLERGVFKPPSPASDLANNASPQKKVASQVKPIEWLHTWTKVPGVTSFVRFTADWCGPCKLMEREVYPDPEVQKALSTMLCYELGEDKAEKWKVLSLPAMFLVGPNGAILRIHEGSMTIDELLEFLENPNPEVPPVPVSHGSYYPSRRINWTLDNRLVNGSHLLHHHKHSWRNYNPAYIKALDFQEVNYLHSADHDEQVGRGKIDRRYAEFNNH